MPSKSAKQARLMAAVAHNPKFAKKVGIPQSVGQEYYDADHKADGGYMDSSSFGDLTTPRGPSTRGHRKGFNPDYVSYARLDDDEDVVRRPENRRARARYGDQFLKDLAVTVNMADGGYLTAEKLLGGIGADSKILPHRYQALLAKGVGSQVLTRDPDTGQLKMGLHPGIIDELLALPAAFGSKAEFSTKAAAKTDAMDKRLLEVMGIDPAHGIDEHLAESAGQMLAQLPVPEGALGKMMLKGATKVPKAVRAVGKIPAALMEYLSPTINPSAANYLSGTAAGGVLGAMGDGGDRPDELQALSAKYGDGGKVAGAARAIRAIKNVIGHIENNDRASAIRELSVPEAISEPEVARILGMLRGPENSAAGPALNKIVEADTNTRVPMLSKGGSIKDVIARMHEITGLVNSKYADQLAKGKNANIRVDDPDYNSLVDEYSALHSRLSDQAAGPVKKAKGGRVRKPIAFHLD